MFVFLKMGILFLFFFGGRGCWGEIRWGYFGGGKEEGENNGYTAGLLEEISDSCVGGNCLVL